MARTWHIRRKKSANPGVFNMGEYSGWGHFGFHWITPFHNIAGMLTESASAKLASPLFIHPEQLQGGARNLPKYEEETIFPNPWPGGWWQLRDIVDRQKISAWAMLDLAARNQRDGAVERLSEGQAADRARRGRASRRRT